MGGGGGGGEGNCQNTTLRNTVTRVSGSQETVFQARLEFTEILSFKVYSNSHRNVQPPTSKKNPFGVLDFSEL